MDVPGFVAVTGSSEDVARRFLEAFAGDLNQAVESYFENPQGFQERPSSSNASTSTDVSNEDVRTPIAPVRGVLVEDNSAPPVRKRKLPPTVFTQNPFEDFRSNIYKEGNSSKVDTLAAMFRPPVDMMFPGTFREAREEGIRTQKWVLVNIQDPHDFASQILNRDVWSNQEVKAMVKQYFIFWQESRIMDDALQFIQFYNVRDFPYIALIDPRTGENMLNCSKVSVNSLLSQVNDFLVDNTLEDQTPASKRKRSNSNEPITILDDSEDIQLANAIAASLRDMQPSEGNTSKVDMCHGGEDMDQQCQSSRHKILPVREVDIDLTRESAPSKFSHCEETFSRQESASNGIRQLRNDLKLLQVDRFGLKESKGKQPRGKNRHLVKVSPGGSTKVSGQNMTYLLLRLPDGSRVEQSFPADQPIKMLFDFLKSHNFDCSKGEYEVISTHPRFSVSALDSNLSFKEANMYPRYTLYVQNI